MRLARSLSLVLSLAAAPALVACGGSGTGAGNTANPGLGVINLVSFAPNPILGCAPVPYTITGNNFETVTGTTARITWRAQGGLTPFAGGTTDRVVTFANVTSDTTIDGLSPNAILCGVPLVLVELDVTLESGVTASSTGVFQVQINAPTIVSINPNPIPAAIPTFFTITGTGFPAAGGPVTIRFTGDNGALLWNDGTKNFIDVIGVVTSTTTLTGTTPIGTVCGDGLNAVTLAQLGASIQLFFPDGCCTLPTAPGFVNFLAPAVVSVVPNSIPAELPPPNLVVNGTNFGPPNTVATVRFQADGNVALFNDGTLNTIDVPGLIGPGSNTITLIAPTATVCGVASRTATMRVIAPYGSSCRQTAPAFITFTAPVIATVNGAATGVVPAHIPTSITIQGTGFGPANGLCKVIFISEPASPAIFGDGTQIESAPVQGVINGAGTQITVTTPHATVQGAASRFASLRILFQGDSCATYGPNAVQFTAATLTSIAALAPTAGTFFAAVPTSFQVNGTNFGPTGSEVFVRFIADNGATPFGNGTQNAFEVPGTVTAPGTITGVSPLAAVCPQTTLGATVRVLFQDGGQSANTTALTFTAPSIVFSPTPFPGATPTPFTITGTGFGPANSLVAVKFTATNNLTPFADGTLNEVTVTGTINGAGTQITGLTPLATICGVASITATVTTTFQGGACASTAAGAVTITAPTIVGALAPSAVPAAIPTQLVISGTGFGVNGQLAQVTFSVPGAPPATPFNNGSASEVAVTGTVGGGGTTITLFTPAVAACPTNVVADVRVTLQNGSCTALTAAAITFLAPTVTTQSLALPLVSLQNPGTMTITGANYGPTGGQAVVRWTANNPIFADGTSSTIDIPGTITNSTTITTTAPIGRLCLANAAATARVILPMGACGDSPANFLTWTAPVLTTTAGGPVPSFNPTPITITGSTFPVVGTPVSITLSGGGQVWNNGTASSVTILGVVSPANTVTFTPPALYTCASVTVTPALQFGQTNGVSGGCSQLAPTFGMNAPATVAIAPTTTPALAPGVLAITGTNFPTIGTPVQVRLLATAPAGSTPFSGGTQSQIVIPAVVNPANTISFTPPVCCVTANTTVSTNLTFQNANCEVAGPTFTLNAPTITTVTPATEPTLAPTTPVVINGTNFPIAGTPVQVTFAGGGIVWNGGTTSQTTVNGTVTTSGTVITVANPPVAQSCVTFTPTVTVTFAAVSAAGCPLTANGPQYVAPTLTAFATSGTGGGANIARQTLPNPFTITSTGFTPLGAPVIVRFTNTGGATTPFQSGTSDTVDVAGLVATATTITGVTPLAVATTPFTASVQVFLPTERCAVSFSPVTFNPPPVITSFVNTRAPFQQAAPASFNTNRVINVISTPVQVNGANFVAGATTSIFQTAGGPGAPIGTGALSTPVVAAAQITGGSPTDSTLTSTLTQATVRVTNPDGQFGTFAPVVYSKLDVLPNVNASSRAGNNAEMNIAINPTNNRVAVICAHDLTGTFSNVFTARTSDAGAAWTGQTIGGAQDGFNAAAVRIDPMCASDAFGNFYIGYVMFDVPNSGGAGLQTHRIVILQSADGGATWGNVRVLRTLVVANGANGLDRCEIATGKCLGGGATDQTVCVGWHNFASAANPMEVGGCRATGLGALSAAFAVSIANSAAPAGGTDFHHTAVAIGPHGELYVTWIQRNGNTASSNVFINLDPDGLGSATLGFGVQNVVTTVFRPNSRVIGYPIPQANRGYACIPALEVVQTGPFAGRVVVAYDDKFFDDFGPGDQVNFGLRVLTRYSDSQGATFSSPVQAHVLDTRHQFQPWLAADPVTGNMYVTWRDSINDPANNRTTQRFSAVSKDGGGWINPLLLSQTQSDINTGSDGNDYLEYEGIASVGGFVYACWCDFTPGNGDVFASAFQQDP